VVKVILLVLRNVLEESDSVRDISPVGKC